jgi:acetylornithine deacetylase
VVKPAALDAAVEAHVDEAIDYLERLVRARSIVGAEAEAQAVVGSQLADLGWDVRELPIPETIVDDPLAGVPDRPYAGRSCIYGVSHEGPPAVLINGHVDVVPAGREGWRTDPWTPVRRDGLLWGRGAGDMKGGFAMAVLALLAVRTAAPSLLDVPIGFVSVLEEECTGNGTLAALQAGVRGDVVVLPEPTDLSLLLGGVGVTWVDVLLVGEGGHAESADRLDHVLGVSLRLVPALEELGQRMAAYAEPPFDGLTQPFNVNVGTLKAGDWRSSVASEVTLGVRVGHPGVWSEDRVLAEVGQIVELAAAGSGVVATVTRSGLRARGYALDPHAPLARAVATAHRDVVGLEPEACVIGSTTDARYYVNAGIQALCYGPKAHRIHGVNEAVDLTSIVTGARVLARFLVDAILARQDGRELVVATKQACGNA